MITVLAIDPGVTTGFALGLIDDEGLMKVATGQEKWSTSDLWKTLNQIKPDIIVYENFHVRGNKIQGLEIFSRELIGIINLYGETVDNVKLYDQWPQEALAGFYQDSVLKKHHIYKVAKGNHCNDAARHLLQWYTFKAGYVYNKKGFEPA